MRRLDRATLNLADRVDLDLYRDYDRHWNMENCERLAMIALLGWLKPACSLEVGTREGGSLEVIAGHSGKVYTLDVDPTCREAARPFPNAEFVEGPSQETLPGVLRAIEGQGLPLEFVLVDGDHSEAGVLADLECLLAYKPSRPCYILMHDSFNPYCRKGMADTPWERSPHVHWIDLDFVPGKLFHPGEIYQQGNLGGQMWGGFGMAVLRPEERVGPLKFMASCEYLNRVALRRSVHNLVVLSKKWLGPRLYQGLRRAIGPRRSSRIKTLLSGEH